MKEKLLAALRAGIKRVIIPEHNAKDLVEISDDVKSVLEIIPVSRMDEVLDLALVRKPEPITWKDNDSANDVSSGDKGSSSTNITTH